MAANVDAALTVNGLGSVADQVLVEGTNSHDRILVDSVNRTVRVTDAAGTVLKEVTLADDVEQVIALGRNGNDTFTVVPAPQVGAIVEAVEGGAVAGGWSEIERRAARVRSLRRG